MKYTFDYAYMRDEMIDFSLRSKNKEMFMHLTSEHFEEYIAHYLGFANQDALECLLKQANPVKQFIDWIEENKYDKHKLVIRYLIEHPSRINVQEDSSCEKWDIVSTILEKELPTSWLYHEMTRLFNEDVAKDFLTYIGTYKQN